MTIGDKRAAFTLIELLASMAVLAILMLICGNVISSSTQAWDANTARVEQNTSGRAAVQSLTKYLAQAVVSTQLVFKSFYNEGPNPYGISDPKMGIASRLVFCSFNSGMGWLYPDEVQFCVMNLIQNTDYEHYSLYAIAWHGNSTNILTPGGVNLSQVPNDLSRALYYGNYSYAVPPFSRKAQNTDAFWIDNVTTFAVLPNGNPADYYSGDAINNYRLPAYVDVLIGTLSDADARRIVYVSDKKGFIRSRETRFVQRVYLANRCAIPAPRAQDW